MRARSQQASISSLGCQEEEESSPHGEGVSSVVIYLASFLRLITAYPRNARIQLAKVSSHTLRPGTGNSPGHVSALLENF